MVSLSAGADAVISGPGFDGRVGVGPYAWDREGLRTLLAIVGDRRRVVHVGFPRLQGDTPADVAVSTLRQNAGPVLSAGGGHFRAMWTADTGKAFRGAMRALPRAYLVGLVDRMLRESAPLGRVPTAWTERAHHELPWPRADNAPWLMHMAVELGDDDLLARRERDLERVYTAWFDRHIDTRSGLLRREVRGDWMDTVPRESSTYNNLCALRAYAIAQRLGLRGAPAPYDEAVEAILARRWTGSHLRAHAQAGDYVAADAAVPALYLDVMPAWVQRKMARTLADSRLVDPVPLRAREGKPQRDKLPTLTKFAPSYHTTIWTHLGLMMCVGMKRLEMPWRPLVAPIEKLVMEHGTFFETLDLQGEPYVRRFLATEYHFTMAAGPYLELVSPPEMPGPQ